ncbi:MFS transporter [Bacillus sp. FJAT-27225]|uniref:MDR family MFS transporter n=1 Tax=Bacillus sp. FJAT-27225 TaxID=1743144 RepID=UPI00080C22FE|nr:MFS transporter [Bacillus sp. FJAT-27225]OCA86064.1 MFS transporter [Bacillus sp. FJAT-27225]
MGFRKFHRNIKIRITESFLSSLIGGMIFPFAAIYLAQHFGTKTAGILLLVNVGVGLVINFFGGYFSDAFGRKKVMVAAEFMRFIAFSLMMVSNSPWFTSPEITFLMMTVNSICWGLAGPAGQAMLIDVSKPEERKEMFTIMYWANNLSIALGGLLGGYFFKEYLFELLVALSVAALLTWVLITFFIKETYFPADQHGKSLTSHGRTMVSGYKQVLVDKLFILYVLAGILVLSMEFQLTNYISIRLAKEMPITEWFGWSFGGIEMLGFLRTENTILVVVMALFAAKFVQRYKDQTVLLGSCFVFVIGYAFISYSNNVWILLIAMVIATIAEVARVPVQQQYMAELPPENARSSYMAVSSMSYNMTMLVCSVTVTVSAFLSSFGTTIFITGIGLAGVAILYWILPALDQRTKKTQVIETSGQATTV